MAASQGNRPVQRMYGPVRLDGLDPPAQLQMRRLTRQLAEFGASVVGFAQGHHIASLGEGVVQELIDGTAREGLAMGRVCQDRTGVGRIGERLVPEPLRDAVEIGVRAALPLYGFGAIHEHVTSIPVRPGKNMHGLGIDQVPGRSRMGHLLLSSVGSDDRTFPTQALWLPTGTADDRTSPRANLARIERWSDELERKLEGSLRGNLREMFAAQRRAREAVRAAVERSSGAFAAIGLDPVEFLEHCFPRCVILDKLACGPPTASGASSAEVVYPGDDETIVEAVEGAGRYGIARCSSGERIERGAIERSLLPELSERFGERPEPVAQHVLERVASWDVASALGIGVSVRVVRYWHFKESGHLLRAAQLAGHDGGQVHDVRLWRTIRLDSSLLRETVVLVERAQQPWPGSCVERYREECEPGRMNPSGARQREGLLKATLLANAAGVSAHRAMEVRRSPGSSRRAQVRETN